MPAFAGMTPKKMSAMIFSPFERMVAMRYLRARRQEGFISVIGWFSLIGIALGVATLIVVMSVMNGFRVELFQRVIGLNGHMNIYAMQGPLMDYQPLQARIAKIADVRAVSPTIEGQALVSREGAAAGVYVRGVVPDAIRQRATIAAHIVDGSLDKFGGDGVAIGVRLAERLAVHAGDTITLFNHLTFIAWRKSRKSNEHFDFMVSFFMLKVNLSKKSLGYL